LDVSYKAGTTDGDTLKDFMTVGFDDTTSEMRRSWTIVLASTVGMLMGVSALPFYTLGVFAKPILGEFGWSRGQYQGAFLTMIVGAATAPFVGSLCDRFGVRRIALTSTVAFALAFAGIGLVTNSSIESFYAAWLVMAVVAQGTGPLAWTRLIGGWFSTQRGLALGISLMGSGIAGFIAPPIATALIAAVGWRETYVILGATVLAIGWPTLWLLLRDPPVPHVSTSVSTPNHVSLKAALATYRFWIIAVAFCIFAFGIAGVISNLIPLLTDRGPAAAQAAAYASTVGLAVISGRVLVGYLMDKVWAPGIAFVVLAAPAASCLALATVPLHGIEITAALIIVGFAAGAEFDMMAFLAARYFGLTHYGKIYGVLYAIFFMGAALAPAVFGRSFDVHRSYVFILSMVAAATVAGACSLLLLGPYPKFDTNR